MAKRPLATLVPGFIAVTMLGGCAASASSNSFPRSSARTGFDVLYGEVVSARVVEIEGEPSLLGQLGGALLGHAIGLGNTEWYTGARRVQAAVGGVAGTVAGEAIERKARTGDGLEIVVRLDRDETIAVIQAGDVAFNPGDTVQVLIGPDGSRRVQHP